MGTKYSYHWRDSARLRMGLLWKRDHPTPSDIPNGKTALIISLCVFLVLALVVAVQYQNEAVQAVNLAEKRANQVGECLQGTLRMIETDDKGNKGAIVSKKAEEFKL